MLIQPPTYLPPWLISYLPKQPTTYRHDEPIVCLALFFRDFFIKRIYQLIFPPLLTVNGESWAVSQCYFIRLFFSRSVSTHLSITTSPSGCRTTKRARQAERASRRTTSTSWCAPLEETWWRKCLSWTILHTQSKKTHPRHPSLIGLQRSCPLTQEISAVVHLFMSQWEKEGQ